MSTDDTRDRSFEYLDLLVTTLTQHEKTLDNLIEKLGKVLSQTNVSTVTKEETPRVITFTKIEIPYNRPIEELTRLLETLSTKSKESQQA